MTEKKTVLNLIKFGFLFYSLNFCFVLFEDKIKIGFRGTFKIVNPFSRFREVLFIRQQLWTTLANFFVPTHSLIRF